MNLAEMAMKSDNSLLKAVDHEERENQRRLKTAFNTQVQSIKAILCNEAGYICHVPASFGKDSFLLVLIVVEAYRQCIAEGLIESSRPLLVNTVDTGIESLPMQMFVRYASKRLISYTKKHNINLHFELVKPPLHDQYFIKWCSGQKLIPSVIRKADCSVILKVQPSERYAKRVMLGIAEEPGMEHYLNAPRITCIGSRNDESSRRKKNMELQDLAGTTFEDVQTQFKELETSSGTKLFTLAPIQDLTTTDVFDLIALCGNDPLTKPLLEMPGPLIPAFLENGALLTELYGNGSADVCELVAGKTTHGAGCSGKARYGCYLCTVSSDRSSKALTRYERWNALGADNALRVRDYLARLGADNSKRAFHAKAYCPVTYGRILLQPNTLKSRYLEKMVWLASMLVVESRKTAAHFTKLVRENREMEFDGYRCIANDTMMNPKAKKQFLVMYKEQAQNALFDCFSEKHAVMLSARWGIDGIAASPYRPLAIWSKVNQGERIMWPKTNEEHVAIHGPIVMDRELPDAIALPSIQEHKLSAKQFARSEFDLFNLWQRPTHYKQLTEKNMNCSEAETARDKHGVRVSYCHNIEVVELGSPKANTKIYCYGPNGQVVFIASLHNRVTTFLDWAIDGRKASQELVALIDSDTNKQVDALYNEELASLQSTVGDLSFNNELQAHEWINMSIKHINARRTLTVYLPYLSMRPIGSVSKLKPSKVDSPFAATPRVTKLVKGKFVRGNTRLRTYTADLSSSFEKSNCRSIEMMSIDFETRPCNHIPLKSDPLRCTENLQAKSNIDFSTEEYEHWRSCGGIDKALRTHDEYWKLRVARRRDLTRLREYAAQGVAEELFHAGGLTVQRSYYEQLNATIMRTQLFSDIGAYDFAEFSETELLSHPATITMKQHRQDKAEVLLEIRTIRNTNRKIAKEKVTTSRFKSDAVSALSLWFKQMRISANLTLQYGLEGRLNCVFFDRTVTLVERANAGRTWLRYYDHSYNSIDQLLTTLCGQHVQRSLRSNPKERINTLCEVMSEFSEHKKLMDTLTTSYRTKLEALMKYEEQTFTSDVNIELARERWRTLMISIHENTDHYLAFFPDTKRSSANLHKQVSTTINYLERELRYIESCVSSLAAVIMTAPEQTVSKMTLAQRLMVGKPSKVAA